MNLSNLIFIKLILYIPVSFSKIFNNHFALVFALQCLSRQEEVTSS